jgi:hypothetical protein
VDVDEEGPHPVSDRFRYVKGHHVVYGPRMKFL